ncbi:MAG: glycosyltransferase [Microbacterium sp.]
MTVIVPVFNSQTWLDDCLSSVLSQTGVSLEVLCIDDGSTDQSRRVLQRFAERDPRVHVVTQANSGQSVARNVGLDAARGRYVIFLDSDDFWPIDGLRELVERADRDCLDVLLFDGVAFRDGAVADDIWSRYCRYYVRAAAYRRPRCGPRIVADMRQREDYRAHVGLYLARLAATRAAEVRFIPGIVHQDNPYTFALLLSAKRVAHVRTYFYARRLRPGSTITALQDAASARGYVVSYMAMRRVMDRTDLDDASVAGANAVLGGVYEAARARISRLPESAWQELKQLDSSPDAQAILDEIRG